jgi:branched-chain amino acid transport system permease protein
VLVVDLFLQSILNGVLIGGIYIAIAVGFSICFGVMHIIDFAVGEWLMLGGFIGFLLVGMKVEPLLLIPLVFPIFFVVGYMLQPVIQRVLTGRKANVLMGLVFTFGMSIFLQGLALYIWGHDRRTLTSALSGLNIQGLVTIPTLRLVAFIIAGTVTLAFMLFLARTRLGLSIRATAEDRDTAAVLGVDIARISRLVYAAYAGLTGMAGILIGTVFTIYAEMGLRYTTFAFFTVVLAGMGYLPGILVAGLFLGILQSLVAVYVGGRYIYLVLFLVLYVVLLVSPQGIMGKGLKAE